MMNPLVLTIDLGTQSVRVLLIDKEGNVLHKVQHIFEKPYYSTYPGWAEQKPEVYWDAICKISQQLKIDAQQIWKDIIAVTVTTIRDTCLCVDQNGKPLPRISAATVSPMPIFSEINTFASSRMISAVISLGISPFVLTGSAGIS